MSMTRSDLVDRQGLPEAGSRRGLRLLAGLLAVLILSVDVLTPLQSAVAVLYGAVVLIAAWTGRRRDILVAGGVGITFTLIAYVASHGFEQVNASTLRAFVSLAAIGITTGLALRNQAVTQRLVAQARLIDLSHDMIFARDLAGVVTFWNRAAEEIYGWTAAEAVGRRSDDLLRTRYPGPRAAIEAELMAAGRWEGTLEQRTRAGGRLVLESRWAVQCDPLGKPVGVLETHTDITVRTAAHAALERSERRYRRMFDATTLGVVEEDWSDLRGELGRLGIRDGVTLRAHLEREPGFTRRARHMVRVVGVNPAFRAMAGVAPGVSVDEILEESETSFVGAIAAFAEGEAFLEGETEIIGCDGRRVPVMFAITFPSPGADDEGVFVFVVDLSERRRAQDALLAAQSELAHAARVATLGELTASIAHEVNQPLTAVVTSGEAALRWLRRDPPNAREVETLLGRIVSEGQRAAGIVTRIRSFLRKAPAVTESLSLAGLVEEAHRIVARELARARVTVVIESAPDVAPVRGDRVRLTQVLVNLMVNAGQAMAGIDGVRRLTIRVRRAGEDQIAVEVLDTGPGLAEGDLARLFDPFFTTKAEGMGMGLAICRTTMEAHGGQLLAENQPGGGALFRLILPVAREEGAA